MIALEQNTTAKILIQLRKARIYVPFILFDERTSARCPLFPRKRTLFVAVGMSALGHKRTFAVQKGMSALPPKADMCDATRDVRFVPKADSCAAAKSIGYSMTSSASARSLSGTVNPSALAVFMLITSSNLTGVLDRKLARLLAFEDAVGIGRRTPVLINKNRAVRDQAAEFSE